MATFWTGKRVFVTGATGLLGSWLCRELVARGAEVTALVRDRAAHSNFFRAGFDAQVNVVRGELENYLLLERALNEYEIDTVFHLAAQTIVTTANRNPLGTFASNIQGTGNLLEACRRNRPLVERVLVASSDKAYGAAPRLPYDEETPLRGQHPYDVSKSCADLLAQSYFHTYQLPVAVTRCGNLFGGGDLNFNRIIPGTIRAVLENQVPVIRSDGKYLRDYFYVEDAVAGYLLLAERLGGAGIAGAAFNFSNEEPLTVIGITERILAGMGRTDVQPVILNQATGEIREQHLSAAKAKRVLGWSAQHAMDEGLRRTIAWYREWFAARTHA